MKECNYGTLVCYHDQFFKPISLRSSMFAAFSLPSANTGYFLHAFAIVGHIFYSLIFSVFLIDVILDFKSVSHLR